MRTFRYGVASLMFAFIACGSGYVAAVHSPVFWVLTLLSGLFAGFCGGTAMFRT